MSWVGSFPELTPGKAAVVAAGAAECGLGMLATMRLVLVLSGPLSCMLGCADDPVTSTIASFVSGDVY